jgi:hypothetical protein
VKQLTTVLYYAMPNVKCEMADNTICYSTLDEHAILLLNINNQVGA